MSHGTCPTMRVDNGKGSFYVINKSDFDPDKHSEYEEGLAPEKPKAKAKAKAK